MDLATNLTPIDSIKKGAFVALILETFIVMSITNGTKIVGKNLKN